MPVTQSDINKAIQMFKAKGGLIKELPNELISVRRKVGVSFKWSSPYEDVGIDNPVQTPVVDRW